MGHGHGHTINIFEENRELGSLGGPMIGGGAVVGLVGLAAGYLLSGKDQAGMELFAHSYLTAFLFFMSISFGALGFVLIQHIFKAGWSVVIRRLAEVMACAIPAMFLLYIPVILMRVHLFEWAAPDFDPHADATMEVGIKALYLNPTFWMARQVAYFVIAGLTSWWFLGQSKHQDETGSADHSARMEGAAPVAMILYAITVTFFAFDTMMALKHHWYSSIFGVYFFGGAMMAFFGTMALLARFLQGSGRLAHAITTEHYHDIGKLMFGFMCFWTYIAFSQFMLIWYGNVPEETQWYKPRMKDPWLTVSVILAVGHFMIPFVGLMSRHVKRHSIGLLFWAVWLLGFHYLDLYWIIMPQAAAAKETVPLFGGGLVRDLALLLGVGGVWLAVWALIAKMQQLVPAKDPRIAESLAFENI